MPDIAPQLRALRSGPADRWSWTVRCAFHEAAHAVVAVLDGTPLLRVALLTAGDPLDGWGAVRCTGGETQVIRGYPSSAAMLAAGMVAEGLAGFSPQSVDARVHSSDQGMVEAALRPGQRQEDVEASARAMLSANWSAVNALGERLLSDGEVGGELAEWIIARALPPHTVDRLNLWALRTSDPPAPRPRLQLVPRAEPTGYLGDEYLAGIKDAMRADVEYDIRQVLKEMDKTQANKALARGQKEKAMGRLDKKLSELGDRWRDIGAQS